MNHPADGAGFHEVAGVHGAFNVDAFAIINHVFAACTGGGHAGSRELVERCERRLVSEIILARLHYPATKRPAVTGDCRGGDQAHLCIVKDLVERAGCCCLRELCAKGPNLLHVGIVNPFQRGSGLDQAVALAIDVAVVEVRRCKDKIARLHNGPRRSLGRIALAVEVLCHREWLCFVSIAPRIRCRPPGAAW